nr:uncharacterized mitochondrial protein AtMg00810-like [Tanacetum cinerariifolium]
FKDSDYPDKVYKVIKALYGLHQAPRACTPIETEKPLLKDPDGKDVDVHICRSMIGSLMYLTSSRTDIMFVVCACAHFQVTLKVSHLHAVKRIFRYLKGRPHLGLWYPRDSPFNLVACSDSDYARASLDRKSTTRGCQFLGYRLIYWQCKKQTVVATSSTEAEYIAAASCIYATLSQKVVELEHDKHTQALEIIKLKKWVKKLEKERRSKSLGLKRLKKGRIDDDNAATKDVNVVEPTLFDDEEVTMTMAQTLIKMKAKKVKLLDEQMAQRLHDEKVEQATAREKKYQNLKRKPVSIAQARKNMIIYLKNMAGGMTYDKNMLEIIQVSEFKVEALQVKYPIIDWEIHTEGSRTYWKIIRVSGIAEAYQSFEDMLKGFDKEDLVALWRLVKEKFSTAVPNVDKEKALWVELKSLFKPDVDDVLWKLQRYMHYLITWKLHTNSGVHQVSSTTRRHDMFMLTEKDYPLSNEVMTLMLSAKLQVEEDSEIARDLVMKIFMEANKPKISLAGVDVVQDLKQKCTKGLMLMVKVLVLLVQDLCC